MPEYQSNGQSIFELGETAANQPLGIYSSFSSHFQLLGDALNKQSLTALVLLARPSSVSYPWSLGVDAPYWDLIDGYSMRDNVSKRGRYPCNTLEYTLNSGSATLTKSSTGSVTVGSTTLGNAAQKRTAFVASLQAGGGGSGGSNGSSASSAGAGGGSGLVVLVLDNSSSFGLTVGAGGSGGSAGSGANCTAGIDGGATLIYSNNYTQSRVVAAGGEGGPSAWIGNASTGGNGISVTNGSIGGFYEYGDLKGGDGPARTSHNASGGNSVWINSTTPSYGVSYTSFNLRARAGGSPSSDGNQVGGGASGRANGGNANSGGTLGAGAGGRSAKAGIFNPGNDGMAGGAGSIQIFY